MIISSRMMQQSNKHCYNNLRIQKILIKERIKNWIIRLKRLKRVKGKFNFNNLIKVNTN